jgi:exodeoxyribonuclease V alpha subunit
MAAKTEEITAIFLSERRPPNCNDFFIGNFRQVTESGEGKSITVIGNSEPDELRSQRSYRLYGNWKQHDKFGPQFELKTFVESKPLGRTGIIKYLEEMPGIGMARAIQIYNLWGSDAVRICREHPDLVEEKVKGLSTEKCVAISKALKELETTESMSIDLIDLLSGRGFSKSITREVIKLWGNRAAEIIRRDPYKLMRFRGVGFLKADSFWKDLGLPLGKLKRQVRCLLHAIETKSNGSVWVDEKTCLDYLESQIGGTRSDSDGNAKKVINLDRAIQLGVRAKKLAVCVYDEQLPTCGRCGGAGTTEIPSLFFDGETELADCKLCNGKGAVSPAGRTEVAKVRWLAAYDRAETESFIAKHIAEAELETPCWPTMDHPAFANLTEHQRSELEKSLTSVICCFGGSAGTGKTTTMGALIQAIIETNGIGSIGIGCPTNKAASRLTEVLLGNDIKLQAVSNHRLLGVESSDGGQWHFKHHESNPFPYQFVIIDEGGFPDNAMFESLLRARPKGTHFIFTGDWRQLPPIGAGKPMRDIIDAGVAYGELTVVMRNAGSIAEAAKAIRELRPIQYDKEINLAEKKNLKLNYAKKESAAAVVIRSIDEAMKIDPTLDRVRDIQVICAVNKKSAVAREKLNAMLHDVLNPGGKRIDGNPFRIGDKVVKRRDSGFFQTEHADDQPFSFDDDGDTAFVSNGEFGIVLKVEKKRTLVEFSAPSRRAWIPLDFASAKEGDESDGDEKSSGAAGLELGWACTLHVFQGSEIPVGIVVWDEYPGACGDFGVCKREWPTTSITRSKKFCICVGKPETATIMCRHDSLSKRKTFLAEKIREHRAKLNAALAKLAIQLSAHGK